MMGDNIAINRKTYSLREVMLSIQSVMTKAYGSRQYWIRCEVSRISLHAQSGHCYLELIDKNETAILAQLKGIIWSDKYEIISKKFKAITHTGITAGMKVLFYCTIGFHPVHGMSLTISDVEPSFTLGEMARMKNESIQRMKAEGIYNLNKSKSLPSLPGRIAIISVATSRGYLDFISTLQSHPRKYFIRCFLFEAILQGENAIPTVSRAIHNILTSQDKYDAIAIIRGGAGDAGLSCYDEYALASLIAKCPLPVITGIGHASNETVTEMVSFKNCITPTAAASFLLDRFEEQFQLLNALKASLENFSLNFIRQNSQSLASHADRFSLLVTNQLSRNESRLAKMHVALPAYISRYFADRKYMLSHTTTVVLNLRKNGKHISGITDISNLIRDLNKGCRKIIQDNREFLRHSRNSMKISILNLNHHFEVLKHLNEKIVLLDPVNTLRRGYSITRINGKAITKSKNIIPESTIETELAEGTLTSRVITKK